MNIETLNYIYKLLIDAEELAHNRKEIAQRDLHDAEECDSKWIEITRACYNYAYKEWSKAFDALENFKNKKWN